MRYQTEAVGETTWLLGELPSGGAVTITLYKLSDSSTPALDSNACTETGATGVYKWKTTNITTPETIKTEYLYIMTDGTLTYPGKIVVGGYVDNVDEKASDIKTQIDKMNFTGTDIKATLDGEKVSLSDATETQIDDIKADTNEMQGKLPDDDIAGSIDKNSLESKHGTGLWESNTPSAVAAAVWNALHANYQLAGSMGEYMTKIYNAAKKVFIRAGKP